MKNPLQFLVDARNRNVAQKSGGSSGNSASGPNFNPTTGNAGINVRPNGAQQATRISRRPLYIAMGVLGVAAYGGYWYIQHHDPFDHSTAKVATVIKPATPSSIVPPAVKHPQQTKKPTLPSAGGEGSKPSANTQSTASAQSVPAGSVPKKNPWAAQDAAFQASLGTGTSGGGSPALTWKQSQSTSPLLAAQQAAAPSIAAQNALLAADKAAQQGKKHKKPIHDTSSALITREISPYEVLQGSVIPAVLETGIKSYLPGEITAVVTRDVYSSVNGATLLIPAGAKLVGTYNTATTLGVNRLMAAWTRIEFPNGTYINLPGFGASGGKGYAGFAGEVNDHTWLIFKNALLMSIVDAGMAVASPTSTSSNTTGVTGNQALQDSEESLSQTFGQAEAELLQKYIDIAPTITIKPGYPFNVVATKDLVFPGPYNPAMQTGAGKVTPAVTPKPNPYG